LSDSSIVFWVTFTICEEEALEKNWMEAAVLTLADACVSANHTVSQLENKILAAHPDAAPLLDLCNRLRSAKARLLALKTKIGTLNEQQDLLKQNLAQFLVPASEAITNACRARNLPAPRIAFGSPRSPIQNSKIPAEPTLITDSISNQLPSASKGTMRRKSMGSKTQILPTVEFHQVTAEEYATLDPRTMGHVSMPEVQEVYRHIWSHFNAAGFESDAILARRDVLQAMPKVRALPTALRFLKSLRRIDLNKEGDIKLALQ
jgi:hypothetical protein